MGIKKRIKKVIFSLALTAILCITFTGCELPFDTIWPESSDNQISNKAYPQSAASTEDIIQYISDAVHNNDNVCEIFVEDETLIDANLWLSSTFFHTITSRITRAQMTDISFPET